MTQPDHVEIYLRSLGPATAPQKRIGVSPRVRTPEPLPIDWRRAVRSVRLAVGTVICAVPFVGHNWRWNDRVQAIWVADVRQHVSLTSLDTFRRTCNRCAISEARIVGGKWRKSA